MKGDMLMTEIPVILRCPAKATLILLVLFWPRVGRSQTGSAADAVRPQCAQTTERVALDPTFRLSPDESVQRQL